MQILKNFVLPGLLLAAMAGSAQTQGESKPPLTPDIVVGTWRLIAVHSWDDKGKKDMEPYGPHPTGLITYTADGRMSVLETYDNRKPLSADREAAPVEERAAAFSTMVAYAGSYTLEGDKVIHHIEVSATPGPNRDQVRYVTLEDRDHLTLRTPPLMRNGVKETHEMVWVRVK